MTVIRKHQIEIGGAMARWYDAGGSGATLHFYHANAYPFRTYGQFINRISDQFHVIGVGHRATWEGNGCPDKGITWETYADDLIAFLDQKADGPVIGAGHSMGAVATLFAAYKRPDLFRSLVLIDPVFFPRLWWFLFRLTPDSFVRRSSYVAKAVNRPDRWNSVQEGVDFHRRKRAFARFEPQAFVDFGAHGLVRAEDGSVRLAFPKQWEAHIYCSVPYVWEKMKTVDLPTVGIRGRFSDVLTRSSWEAWKRLRPADRLIEIPNAGHMAPMECPLELASMISNAFSRGEI